MANLLRLPTLTLLVVACALPGTAWAQDSAGTALRSGYELKYALGGPNSVQSDLRFHDAKKESLYRGHVLEEAFAPYYALKKDLNQKIIQHPKKQLHQCTRKMTWALARSSS